MAHESRAFLSTLPPDPVDRRLAWWVIGISAAAFAGIVPFAKSPLPPVPAFIPIYQSALIVGDLVTAVLLLGQFAILRAGGMLLLGCAYLFSALIAAVHLATFPGLFSPTGLLGAGAQTTAWLYMYWHGGFPLLAIGYALLGTRISRPERPAAAPLAAGIAAVCIAAAAGALLTTAGHDLLPPIMRQNRYTPTMIVVVGAVWLLSVLALIVLWRRRSESKLNLWLTVVMCAWIFDIALAAVLNAGRYDAGFYAGRIYGLLAAMFVLAVLLLENGALYARLARALDGERGERLRTEEKTAEVNALNATLEERVSERTAELEAANQHLQEEMLQRGRAESDASEAQQRLAGIIDSAMDAVITVDQEQRIVLFNTAAEEIFGCPREHALGTPLDRFVPTSRRAAHAVHVRRFGETEQDFRRMRSERVVTALRHDGEEFPIDASISHVNVRGRKYYTITARDITERKLAERRIYEQLASLKLLDQITRSISERLDLQSILQVVVGTLEDALPIDLGCVLLRVPGADSLRLACLGTKAMTAASAAGLDAHAVIPIAENGLDACLQGTLVCDPDIRASTLPFACALARAGMSSLVMAPLRAESQVFGALVAARRAPQSFSSTECEFLRQLSEHVALAAQQTQLHDALQHAYDDLRQTQQAVMQQERLRALGQMASGIAHDINNALSPVSLYTESLLESEPGLSERARRYLQTIHRAVEDVAHTVARMREFYRQREEQLALAPLDLNQLVEQVVELTRARWNDMPQQRGVTVRAVSELAFDLPRAMGIESEIREALTNLVFNAVDAMPEGGTLRLRTRLADASADPGRARIAVEVADDGIGMDEATRQRCLEPFFTTKGERGTGLGLAMVFGVVQRHGADLEIDSAPGAGTTMRLVFPVPAAASAPSGRPDEAPAPPPRLRLLMIDDDPVLLKSLRDTLEEDGHVIVTAGGGAEGIAAFRASLEDGRRFAAVITDLGMPHVDGRQVAAAVKGASGATPVILLTGWGQRLVAENEVPPHVDRVLSKPPKLRELRDALGRLCGPAAG